MSVEQHCWVSFAWTQQAGGSSSAESLVAAVMQEAEKSKLHSGSALCWADNSRGWHRSKIIERDQKGWLSFNPILQVLSQPVLTCKMPTAPLRSRSRSECSSFVCLIYREHFMPGWLGCTMNELLDYEPNILEAEGFYKSPCKSAANLKKRSAKFFSSQTVCTAWPSISCFYEVSAYTRQAQGALFHVHSVCWTFLMQC